MITRGLGPPSPSLLLSWGLGGAGGAVVTTFFLAGAAQIGPLAIRVSFSKPPLAVDATQADDATNPASWTLTGPVAASVVAAGPVTGDPNAVDVYVGALLAPGTWTIAVAPTVEDLTATLVVAPLSEQFSVAVAPTLTGVAGGAVNEGILREHLNPAIEGEATDDLIFAIEGTGDDVHGDAYVSETARLAFLQLFPSTASGQYLTKRASEVGVTRPDNVGLTDDAFRQLVDALGNRLLTDHAVQDVLEVFYGPESTRATLTSSLQEPFRLQDGDDLVLVFEETQTVTVRFSQTQFARVGQATAVEVAATIDRQVRQAGVRGFASAVVDPTTGLGQVRVHAAARGVPSGIRCRGGRGQVALRFPQDVFTGLSGPFGSWTCAPSPDRSGRIRITSSPTTPYDLSLLREGDLALIYGAEFPSFVRGTEEVLAVSVTLPGGILTQWFEIAGPTLPSTTVPQLAETSLVFQRPTLRSVHDADTPAYAVEVDEGLSVVLPATSSVVSRGAGRAGYLVGPAALPILSLDRDAVGRVTLTFGTAHGLSAGDGVLLDGLAASPAFPTVHAGTPSATLGASH